MSTVDDVQQAVLSGMIRGELSPGTWLRQDELAAELGTSKIPVREALQRLAATGLLRFVANRGVMVPTMTADEAEENYALRRAIEPQLLARGFDALSIVDLAEAELALTSTDLSLTEANWGFHRSLYRPSGWERGLAMTETLHAAVAPYVMLYTEGLGGGHESRAEHQALLAACQLGDEPRAITILLHHLDNAADALSNYFRSMA